MPRRKEMPECLWERGGRTKKGPVKDADLNGSIEKGVPRRGDCQPCHKREGEKLPLDAAIKLSVEKRAHLVISYRNFIAKVN